MQSSTTNTPTSEAQKILDQYAPERTEEFVLSNVDGMYTLPIPTIGQIRMRHGDAPIRRWIARMLAYMLQMTSTSLDETTARSLVGMIMAKYHFLKLTEFMHFVFIYRSGDFGKSYGKINGHDVMLYLKDFMQMREDRLRQMRLASEQQESSPEMRPDRTARGQEVCSAIIAFMSSPEWHAIAEYRREPWAYYICRAYFAPPPGTPRLSCAPWELTREQRYRHALECGYKDPTNP